MGSPEPTSFGTRVPPEARQTLFNEDHELNVNSDLHAGPVYVCCVDDSGDETAYTDLKTGSEAFLGLVGPEG